MSAINYFTRARAQQLVREMRRVLRPGGVCRVGVQDMRALAERYVRGDTEFFFQKLPDGRDRFEGPTLGDKFAAWFYGYAVGANRCEYFYDFESLAYLFREAGFSLIEHKAYRESRLPEVELFDNRADQMFFLEALK
jgi:ubiquinone/menaquinone biosynthesis C-methylase UbiE